MAQELRGPAVGAREVPVKTIKLFLPERSIRIPVSLGRRSSPKLP